MNRQDLINKAHEIVHTKYEFVDYARRNNQRDLEIEYIKAWSHTMDAIAELLDMSEEEYSELIES